MSRSRLRVLILIGAFAVLSGGCTDGGAAGTLSISTGGASTTSASVESDWVKGSLDDLPLPERDGPPRFLGVVVHEFEGVTFLGPRGVVRTIERDIGKFDNGLWLDQDTVEYQGRVDSDLIEVIEASVDGTIRAVRPSVGPWPRMVAGDVGLYSTPQGMRVGSPGAMRPVELDVLFLAPHPDGWFLATRFTNHPMAVLGTGAVEPYPTPPKFAMTAAAFGPRGLLAVALRNRRLVILSGHMVVEVDRLPDQAVSLGWDRTGTMLVAAISGEPPAPKRWVMCDLLDGGTCRRFGPEYWTKDQALAPSYWD